jgi:hypothetical protein
MILPIDRSDVEMGKTAPQSIVEHREPREWGGVHGGAPESFCIGLWAYKSKIPFSARGRDWPQILINPLPTQYPPPIPPCVSSFKLFSWHQPHHMWLLSPLTTEEQTQVLPFPQSYPLILTNHQNACYYKRNLNTYGRRAPGGAEIACAAPSTHNIERGLGVAADVRSSVWLIWRAGWSWETDWWQSSCYYRRDSNGKTVGYRRGVNGTEVHCGAERRHEMMADVSFVTGNLLMVSYMWTECLLLQAWWEWPNGWVQARRDWRRDSL